MAQGKLNLKVSKQDFQERINIVEIRIAALVDVIDRYNNAKANLDQFIEEGDSNYQDMVVRIDENIKAAKKAHAALTETKNELQATVDKMENMGNEIGETIKTAAEAAKSTVEAAIKVDAIL